MYELRFWSCECNYAQISYRITYGPKSTSHIRNVLLGPQLVDLDVHAALTKKRKIFDSNAVVGCVVRWYTPYTFEVCLREKKKEERKKEEEEQHKTEISTID